MPEALFQLRLLLQESQHYNSYSMNLQNKNIKLGWKTFAKTMKFIHEMTYV